MTTPSHPQVQTEAGQANPEQGFVVLDGPDGVAVTMTVEAAVGTGNSLLAAAEIAAAYDPSAEEGSPDNRVDPD